MNQKEFTRQIYTHTYCKTQDVYYYSNKQIENIVDGKVFNQIENEIGRVVWNQVELQNRVQVFAQLGKEISNERM